jgi:Arc/MetJ-type ribon-helix-helix transcriptional regulator
MVKEAKERVRITIDLTPKLYQLLQGLEFSTDASSKADVVRNALRLLKYMIDRKKEGYKLFLEKDGEKEQVVIFDLES